MRRPPPVASVIAALLGALLLLAGCATPGAPAPQITAPTARAGDAKAAPAPVPVAPAVAPHSAAPVAPTTAKAAPPSPAAPTAVTASAPATIVGSEEASAMFDNFTVYLVAIDGRRLSAGREGWNIAYRLPAGRHRVSVAFTRGVFTAHADLDFEAKPGANYRVRFATDAQVLGQNSYCDFWIENTNSASESFLHTRAPLERVAATN